MKTPLQHFSTRRLSSWQSEWEFLQCSLAAEPDAAQAWWWKLRLRVLNFVIKRYGADATVRALDHAPAPGEAGGDLMIGERRTVEPRPREALGAHLQSIAKENDFPRPPAPPDEDDDNGILESWIAAHLRQLLIAERFIFGAIFGLILGGSVAISAGVRDGFELCMYLGLSWVVFGVLAALFGGLLWKLVTRLLARR